MCLPGIVPSRISGWPNCAFSPAKMISHIIASSQPPPSWNSRGNTTGNEREIPFYFVNNPFIPHFNYIFDIFRWQVAAANIPLRRDTWYTQQTHWQQQSQVSSRWTLCSSEPRSSQQNTAGRFDSASLWCPLQLKNKKGSSWCTCRGFCTLPAENREKQILGKKTCITSKGSLAASDDDGSNATVGLKVVQGLSHLPHQSVTQGIQSLGSVQLDETHVFLLTSLFHQNVLILTTCTQRNSPPMTGWRWSRQTFFSITLQNKNKD